MTEDTEHSGENVHTEEDNPDFESVYSQTPSEIGFFTRVYRASVDTEFYRLVLIESTYRTIWFLVKLLLLASVISSFFLLTKTIPVASSVYSNLQEELPRMTIQNGDIKVDGKTPVRVQLREQNQLVIDPEATINRLQMENNVIAVLVNGGFYYRWGTEEFQFVSTRSVKNTENAPKISLSPQNLKDYKSIILGGLILANIMGSIVLQSIMNIVRIGLIAFGGWIFCRSMEPKMNFRSILKITCYVITPLIGIDLIVSLTGIPLSSFGSTYEMGLLLLGSFWIYRIQKQIKPSTNNDDDSEFNHTI